MSATLDPSYSGMMSLRYLDLSRNNIRRIYAKDFDAVRHIPLETVNLADCGLIYIDELAFQGMDNLTSLTLARSIVNQSVLEKVFQSFSIEENQMIRLDLSETFITNLTSAMLGTFKRLVSLFASYCDLEHIEPELLQSFPDLETLHIEGGQLTRLDNISSLKKLRRISAHMNRLSNLNLNGLNALELVDLSYNQFEHVPPSWISGTDDIQMMNLSHNKITYISPDAIVQSATIQTLDLSFNQLATFPNFGSLKLSKLDVSHNGMYQFAPGAFDTLHQTLNELDLSYNELSKFTEHVFRDFHLLQYLGLGHNRLGEAFRSRQLGGLLESLQLVQVLDISYNDITVIQSQDLSNLHHLNTLYIQGNLIRDLKDVAMDSTRVLAKLVASGNQLHIVDAEVLARLEYLEEIDLSDNPFECTCSIVPFLQWTNTTMVTVLVVRERSEYRCDFPPDAQGLSIFARRRYSQNCDASVSGPATTSTTTGNIVTAAALVTCALAAMIGAVLACHFGQLCRRVKSLRYRWQIRYREVSGVETVGETARYREVSGVETVGETAEPKV